MKACAVSFKECWQSGGRWWSSGGFPLQMAGVASLFDSFTLAIVEGPPRAGGLPLPEGAEIVTLRPPRGEDARRKLSIMINLPAYLGALVPAIRRADVVHVPLPGDIPLIAMLLAVAMRKRVIARYGGSWARTEQTTPMNSITRGLMRLLAGRRNVMLATGDGETPPAPRMQWIFSTALSAAELAQARADGQRGWSEPRRLVYAGRLSSEKGVQVLIDAIAILAQRSAIPPLEISILGDGPQRSALEAQARERGVESVFRFRGQVDRAALSRELAASDICVQPSLTEGYSKAWLDAMAHGVPVLASNVGAAAAVIGGDGVRGWLVPPGRAEDLASALARILAAPLNWPALRERCRSYVAGRTLESWAARIGQIAAAQWGVSVDDGRLRLA